MAEQQQRRSRVVKFLSNHGTKLGALAIVGTVVAGVGSINKLQQEVNEHRAGLCGKSDDLLAENQRLKKTLLGLRERVLEEVNHSNDKRPLSVRLKGLFDSIQT